MIVDLTKKCDDKVKLSSIPLGGTFLYRSIGEPEKLCIRVWCDPHGYSNLAWVALCDGDSYSGPRDWDVKPFEAKVCAV